MFRRLAHLALSLSLFTTAAAPAAAGGFAAPPPTAGAPRRIEPAILDEAPLPTISDAARARLREILGARRDRNIAAFRGYVTRGRYPHNFRTEDRLNVWRDREGHLCAAATMIDRSGAHKLVARVARTNNFVRLADVSAGPLYDWILTSGLTHAEVIAIQEPFDGRDQGEPVRDWRQAEDDRLRARYAEVLAMLDAGRDASLEAAIDALAGRPELVARLLGA